MRTPVVSRCHYCFHGARTAPIPSTSVATQSHNINCQRPAAAAGKVQGAMNRKRACDVCYKRKIQCSVPKPNSPCEWCHEHGLSCTFDRKAEKKHKKRFKFSDVEGLFSRVEQLENAVASIRSDPLPHRLGASGIAALASPPSDTEDDVLQSESSPSTIVQSSARESTDSPIPPLDTRARSTQAPPEQVSAFDVPLSQYWYSRGIPLLSEKGHEYIHSKTNEKLSLEKPRAAIRPGTEDLVNAFAGFRGQGEWKLPRIEIIRDRAGLFFVSPAHRNFPVLARKSFEETIKTACGCSTERPSLPEAQAIACVFAALAVFNFALPRNFIYVEDEAEPYAMKARGILGYIMTAEPSVVGLEMVLLLRQYCTLTANEKGAAQLHTAACSMACGLGYHAYQPMKHTEDGGHQQRRLRDLFLLCYTSDKDISLRSGQPPLLADVYWDLPGSKTGPISPFYSVLGTKNTVLEFIANGLGLREDLGLYRLKAKIQRLLYSPSAFTCGDADLVARIRRLDDDLERWRLSLPLDIRPKLSVPPMTERQVAHSYGMPMRLQLEYHHLVTAIHTPVRRCGRNNPSHKDLPDDIHNVIHSSCDLSLEASRSTINLLRDSAPISLEIESSDISFYATLAVVSLFIDGLAHPQNIESNTTLMYISYGIIVIEELLGRGVAISAIPAMQDRMKFVNELRRLVTFAYKKAQGIAPNTNDVPH